MSPISNDELKSVKSEINQLKHELGHTRRDVTDRLFSMDMSVSTVRYRVEEIDSHVKKITEQMTAVS